MGVVLPQSGRGFKNSRALRAQLYYWNPPSGNPGSATVLDAKLELYTPRAHCTFCAWCELQKNSGNAAWLNVAIPGVLVTKSTLSTPDL